MAIIVASTLGNDTTGDGSIATPFYSLQKCIDTVVNSAGDHIWIRQGTYPLTANVTSTKTYFTLKSWPGEMATFTGAFTINLGSTDSRIVVENLTFTNRPATATIPALTLGAPSTIIGCSFISATSGIMLATQLATNVRKCVFNYTGSGYNLNPANYCTNSSPVIQHTDNIFINQSLSVGTSTGASGNSGQNLSGSYIATGNIYYNCINAVALLVSGTGLNYVSVTYNLYYNTIPFRSNSSGSVPQVSDAAINNNVFYGNQVSQTAVAPGSAPGTYINFTGSGIYNNAVIGSTATLGLPAGSFTTLANVAAAKWYDPSNMDFRIEITSPLNIGNDCIGPFIPDYDAFWSDLAESQVAVGVAYRVRSRVNNHVGTSASGESDPAKVLTSSTVIAGTVTLPSISNVETGTTFGPSNSLTGVYTGANRWSDPGVANVLSGVAYKAGSLTNNRTGTIVVPSISNVLFGVQFGPALSLTGTSQSTNPGISNVLAGVTYKINSTDYTGTYHIKQSTNPGISNVLAGVAYTIDDVNLTGIANVDDLANLPNPSDVEENAPAYGKDLDIIPTLHITASIDPGESNVIDGVAYVIDDVAKMGTLDVPTADEVVDTATVQGLPGNVRLPDNMEVIDGVAYGPNNSIVGQFEALSDSDELDEFSVLKGVPYKVKGINKTGAYDLGLDTEFSSDNIRVMILETIEDKLYKINPELDPVYSNVIKSVSMESGSTEGLLEDDMPHVQVIAEESVYDHSFVLSGNTPMVTMRLNLLVTTPSSYNEKDCEGLAQDIRQAFIRDNQKLDGLVLTMKLERVAPVSTSSGREGRPRKIQISFILEYIETITNY